MDLFDYYDPPPAPPKVEVVDELPFQPRDYQQAALDKAFELFASGEVGAIVRSPTGSGKTLCGTFIAHEWLKGGENRRVLILAHERQLIQQFADEVRGVLGNRYTIAIEMGDQHCTGKEDIIIASRQTLLVREDKDEFGNETRVSRLYKFDPQAEWLTIHDEAHRWARKLKSCRSIIEHFEQNPNSRRLALTATPERTDKTSLQGLFPGVASDYRMYDPDGGPSALSDGWAVPYDQRFVTVDSIDFKNLREVAKDFDAGQLEEILSEQETLSKMVLPTLDLVGNRQTIIFNAGTEIAKKVALYINAKAGKDIAISIDGSYPDEARKDIYRRFEAKEFQFMSVCGLCREGYNCLDDETEVLTEDGWKRWNEFSDVEFLYSLNRDTGSMELVPMENYVRRPVREGEQFVTLKSQHFNVRVTDEHEFHLRRYDGRKEPRISEKYTTFKARELLDNHGDFAYPLSAEAKFPGVELTDDEIKFIAWFMTDGGFAGKGKASVVVTQSDVNAVKQSRIREIIASCGFDCTENKIHRTKGYANASPVIAMSIPKGTHGGKLKRNGWKKLGEYLTKDVSPLLHNMTREQFWLFWKELLLGDGSVQANKSGWLLCDRMSQVNAYTQMAVTRGFATSYAEVVCESGKIVWRVSVRDTKTITSRLSDPKGTAVKQEPPLPNENVWCVSNRNSTIVTRRGGKVLIIGNCPNIQAVAIFRPTKSRPLAEQMKGRGCRPLRGLVSDKMTADERKAAIAASEKPSCIIVDIVGATGLGDCASTAHIFANGKPDEVIERANDNMRKKPEEQHDVGEEIRRAEQEIAEEREKAKKEREERLRREREEMERRAKLAAEVKYQQRKVNSGHGAVGKGERRKVSMPFGKHKGESIESLNTNYLKAFVEKMEKLPYWLKGAINKELDKRSGKSEQPKTYVPHEAGVWDDVAALLRS